MKDRIGRIIPFVIPALVWFLPVPTELSFSGLFVFVIFIGALYLWMTMGIDWPSLWVLLMLVLVPNLSVNEVLRSSFGNQTFAFLLFTFVLTYALSQTQFIKRVALKFVSMPFAQKSIWHLNISFLASVLLLGSVMSPTVLFFVMYPILEEIFKVVKIEKGDGIAKMMIMGLVLVTSLSSAITPIAHVFPVLAMSAYSSITATAISYTSYMLFAIPFGLLIFGLVLLVLRLKFKADLDTYDYRFELNMSIPEVTKQERIITSVFVGVVFMWVVPDLLSSVAFMAYIKSLGTSIPPLIGVVILAIIKVNDTTLLNINEAMTKGVSWPALIMTAATLALGSAMTHPDIGLVTFITSSMTFVQGLSNMLLIIIFVLWASVQSNVSSHMVTAQLVASVAVPVFLSINGLNAAAMASLIGFLASLGSATPPAMPYVAFAVSSQWTTPKDMLEVGLWIMIGVIVLSVLIGYPLANIYI